MLYSDLKIKDALRDGRIVIEPFCERQLGSNSYDVRLGNWYFVPQDGVSLWSPYLEEDVKRYWGEPIDALDPANQPVYQGVIYVPGYTTILAHTLETIGATCGITANMHARSSAARSSLSVCKCAGFGDVGYISRWTMEISNHNRAAVVLPVGMRIAQISFEYVGDTEKEYSGKYGMRRDWSPYDMLPKLYRDWDIIPNITRKDIPQVPYIDTCVE